MKSETVIGALIAAVIGVGTAFMALMNQEGVEFVTDISQKAWIILAVGGALAFLKDYQAITVRRAVATTTGSGNIHGWLLPVVGAGFLMALLAGCSGTQRAYDASADAGPGTTAKVVVEHYYAVVKEANAMKASGALKGGDLVKAQDIVRDTKPAIDALADSAQAFEEIQTADTQASLDQAIEKAATALSKLIDLINQVKESTSSALEPPDPDQLPEHWVPPFKPDAIA